MEIGFSTRRFANQRLTPHILDQIHQAGIDRFEIFAARQHLDYRDSNHLRDVAEWFKSNRVSLNSVHGPLFSGLDGGRSAGSALSLSHTEKRLRIESMDETKRAMDAAEHLRFRYFVVHLGRHEDEYDLRRFDAGFTSLEHLRIFGKEQGVDLLLENTTGGLNTPDRVLQFIHYTRLEMKVCFDVGHAHLTGGVAASLDLLRPLVAIVHLHDNRQEKDDHLMPFEGSIDWQGAMGGLHTLGDSIPGLLELQDHGPPAGEMERIPEVIRKMNAAG